MNTWHDLLTKCGAYFCVECGKCVALCPMAETAIPFSRAKSPRGLVQQALQGLDAAEMEALIHCLQCRSCSSVCPAGVDVAGLIAALRHEAGIDHPALCSVCGQPLMQETTLTYLKKACGEELVYPSLCPSCRRRAYVRNNC